MEAVSNGTDTNTPYTTGQVTKNCIDGLTKQLALMPSYNLNKYTREQDMQ